MVEKRSPKALVQSPAQLPANVSQHSLRLELQIRPAALCLQ
jgi:hypothetical protein